MLDVDYQRFFELSPDLLCIAGFDGYFRRVNPAMSALLGYSDDKLYGRLIDSFVHPEDRTVVACPVDATQLGEPVRHCVERRFG